ncbi:MAG: HAMP domain-containing histidine kinase [Lachnospiraceae bacterium]|nr:HAMP domain-containing histidine kinase [Lachnospiraceae bacterium]
MRSQRVKKILMTAGLILVYLVGLLLIFQTICYFVIWSKRDRNMQFKQNRVNDFIAGDNRDLGNESLYYYDRDGNLLLSREREPFAHSYTPEEMIGLVNVERVLNGEPQMKIIYYYNSGIPLGTSYVITGLPIIKNGETIGFMLARDEYKDLLETLLSCFISFTFLYAINMVFWFANNRRARRLVALRNQYTDNITHELKTPIASIKALAEALADGMADGDENSYYNLIIEEAAKEQNLIQDVLQFSKLHNNTDNVKIESVEGCEVFRESCETYLLLCELMGIDLVFTKEFEQLPMLRTDVALIRVVFDNLMSNAVKFTPKNTVDGEDPGTLSSDTERQGKINVAAVIERRQVVVSISDNGCGISESDLPHIFERFYRAKRNDKIAGSGLGLSIAKAAINNLGEKIWVKSIEGQGSQFYFTIRRAL